MQRLIVLSALAVLTAAGCTSRLETSSATPKARTYSTHIKPITSDARCQECHRTDRSQGEVKGLGTYAFDITKKASIRDMAMTNAKDFVSAQQVQDIADWILAGAPNDDTPF